MEDVKKFYIVEVVEVEVLLFIDDMVVVYEWVDLVVCCFGVFIVSELVVVGVVLLLILYFFVVDDY